MTTCRQAAACRRLRIGGPPEPWPLEGMAPGVWWRCRDATTGACRLPGGPRRRWGRGGARRGLAKRGS
eukprot:scaffold34981_cov112-Isochrysis_galbana.AAC.1